MSSSNQPEFLGPLTKFINVIPVKEIYPMVTKLEAYYVPQLDFIAIRIHVDDSELNQWNMYEKGLDPHYLVDNYIKSYLPYFGIPKNKRVGFTVLSPEGKSVTYYFPSLNNY